MKREWTAEDALVLLSRGHSTEDTLITGEVRLRQSFGDEVKTPVLLQFSAPVVFEDCTFETTNFYAAYCFRGAAFINCAFLSEVSFACGGHNEPPGPVEVTEGRFEQGTNLPGNVGQPFEVQFEVPPVVEGNTGPLALNGR